MNSLKINTKTLNVISGPTKVFPTSQKPFLVLCEDFQEYVYKHNRGSSNLLFNEYISSIFLKIFKINSPKFCFIYFNTDKFHNLEVLLKDNQDLNNSHFEKIGLGFEYLSDTFDIIEIINHFPHKDNDFLTKQLLKIALFDVWIANEDRVFHNSNLLFGVINKEIVIYAIDHGNVLNSNSGENIYFINYNESILNSDFATNLICKYKKNEIDAFYNEVINEFQDNILNCQNYVENLTNDNIPDNWNIDVSNKQIYLIKNLFNKNCTDSTVEQFKEFLNETIQSR